MALPGWADSELSAELPGLRAKGEGQDLEFKEEFPEQAHRLSKEVAALATSGGGRILLGVGDDGSVVGLPATNESERDDMIERAQGIIRSMKPQVRARCRFACDEGKPILVILIEEQTEPVFYYDSRPYVRDGRASRIAEPNEVKEAVWRHPSSEFKREEERIKLRKLQIIADMDESFARSQTENLRRMAGPPEM